MRNIFWAVLPLFIPWLSILFSPGSIILVNADIAQRDHANPDNGFDMKASMTSNHYSYSKEDVDILVRYDLQSEQIVVDINLFNNFDDVMIFVSDENQEFLCETSMQPKYFQRTSCGFPTPSHLKEGGNFVDVTIHSIPEDTIVYRERHYFFNQANGLLMHNKRKGLTKKKVLSSMTFIGLLALGPYAFWRHQQQQHALVDEATIVSPNDSPSPHLPGTKFPPTSSLSSSFSSSSPQLTMRVPSANLIFLLLQWLLSRPQRLVQALLDALHVSTPIGTSPAINVSLTVSPLPSTKTPLSLPASPVVTKEPEDAQPLFSGWYSTKPTAANDTTKTSVDENTRTNNENSRSFNKNTINENDKPHVATAIDSSEEKKRSFTVLTLAALSPVRTAIHPMATTLPPVPSITRSPQTVMSKESQQFPKKQQLQPPATAPSVNQQPKPSSILKKFLSTRNENDHIHSNNKKTIVADGRQQTTVADVPSAKRSVFFHNWFSFKKDNAPSTSESAVSASLATDSKPVLPVEPKRNWKQLLRPLLVTVAVLVVLTQAPQQLHTWQSSSHISTVKNHLDAKLADSWQQLQSLLRNRRPIDASASASTAASASTFITPTAEPFNSRTAVTPSVSPTLAHSASSPIQRPSTKRFSTTTTTTTLLSPAATQQIRTLTSQREKKTKPSFFFFQHTPNSHQNPRYFPRLAIGSDALPLSNADLRLFQEVDNGLFVRRKTRMSTLGHNVHRWGQHVSRVAYLLAGQGMVTMLCWWGKLKPSSKPLENHSVDTNSPSNIHHKAVRNHVKDTHKAFHPSPAEAYLRPTHPILTAKPKYAQHNRNDGLTITSSEEEAAAVDEGHETTEMDDDDDYEDNGDSYRFDETAVVAPHKTTKDTML